MFSFTLGLNRRWRGRAWISPVFLTAIPSLLNAWGECGLCLNLGKSSEDVGMYSYLSDCVEVCMDGFGLVHTCEKISESHGTRRRQVGNQKKRMGRGEFVLLPVHFDKVGRGSCPKDASVRAGVYRRVCQSAFSGLAYMARVFVCTVVGFTAGAYCYVLSSQSVQLSAETQVGLLVMRGLRRQ